jgi:septum formation protein
VAETLTNRVVLASASPRRLALLTGAGFDVVVRPAELDERSRPGEDPLDYVRRLARAKLAVAGAHPDEVAVAADTTVVLNGASLGKPRDGQDAARMLAHLAGQTHEVLTAVAVGSGERTVLDVVRTTVTFRFLSGGEIARYVETGEPLDKAGGYAIQGGAMCFVAHLEGSLTNVVGLPLETVVERLARFGCHPRSPGATDNSPGATDEGSAAPTPVG